MEEIKQILEELEGIHFRHYMVESIVAYWCCQIVSYGFISLGELLDWLNSMSIIDDVEMKPTYYKIGWTDGITNTDFEPIKLINGKWGFKFKFTTITFDLQ